MFNAAHLAATVLGRAICRGRARPQALLLYGNARWNKQSLKQRPQAQAGLRRQSYALDSNKQYGYREFEGSKTALVGVSGAVARDDRTHTHPYCRATAQACNALGSSCKSYTRSAIISRNQSRLKPVERAGKQTAVRRVSSARARNGCAAHRGQRGGTTFSAGDR